MLVKTSNDSNPGDLSLRIDSEEERSALATMFPEFGMEKHESYLGGPYPRPTSLQYNVGVAGEDVWSGSLGWDDFPRAVHVIVRAKFDFEDDKGWKVRVELSRGDVFGHEINQWVHILDYKQKRTYSHTPVNVRQAVCKALKEAVKGKI